MVTVIVVACVTPPPVPVMVSLWGYNNTATMSIQFGVPTERCLDDGLRIGLARLYGEATRIHGTDPWRSSLRRTFYDRNSQMNLKVLDFVRRTSSAVS